LSVSALVVFSIEVNSVTLHCQDRFLLARRDGLFTNVGDVFRRIAADEDSFRMTKIACFGNEFVDVRIQNCIEFLVVRLA
jgi:hypothetical protein